MFAYSVPLASVFGETGKCFVEFIYAAPDLWVRDVLIISNQFNRFTAA